MKARKNYMAIILIVASGFLLNGCLSYMALNVGGSFYKREGIKQSKAYYSEKDNAIAIQIDGKLKKKGKGKFYMLLDLDTVFSIYKPSVNNYVSYTTPEQKQSLGICEIYDSWFYDDSTLSMGIDVYKHAFIKEEFKDEAFKLISSINKDSLNDNYSNVELINWREVPISVKEYKDITAIKVCLLKDKKRNAWWRYCYLPVTIPVDVATSPVQIVFAILIVNGFKKAHRN